MCPPRGCSSHYHCSVFLKDLLSTLEDNKAESFFKHMNSCLKNEARVGAPWSSGSAPAGLLAVAGTQECRVLVSKGWVRGQGPASESPGKAQG